jgi:hypothetical protein
LPLVLLAGCVASGSQQRTDPLELEAIVADPPTRAAATRGPLAWEVPGGAPVETGEPAAPQDPVETPSQRDARLRVQFGSSVLIGADGSVTKQYFLAGDLAQTFLKLIADITADSPPQFDAERKPPKVPPPGTKVGGVGSKSVLGRMLREHEVEVTFVPDFEVLSGAAIAEAPGTPPAVRGEPLLNKYREATGVSLALITAKPASLAAFEAALDLFYTSIQQVEISVSVVEYQVADALAFGVRGPTNTTPVLTNQSSGQLVRSYTSSFPLSQPIVGVSPVTDVGRFALGGIHDAWELNMVLEALEANNLADITSSPKLVVRNGGVASISTLTQVPFPRAKINQLGAEVAVDIDFRPVGVRMNIIPVIAGTDSVILQIYADVSAITGFAQTQPVNTPITSTRTAVTTVHLKNEHTLVIGGLTSQTKFESETKVPILGDIPLLGFLFRSTSTTHNKTTVDFFITPRIVKERGSRL